jgi:patatin-like phospholipase/acyl hydrolase
MPRRYLLSIDSGGIRGIIPAVALIKLEKTTGKLTRETFSFVAGTSTDLLRPLDHRRGPGAVTCL